MASIQELYRQHPVAFIGVVGGGALAAAYVVSQRGKSGAAVTPYPVSAYGTSGQGYGSGAPPSPSPVPCWVSGDCPEPAPGGAPSSACPGGCPPGQVCTAIGCVGIPGPAPCHGDNCNPPIRCGPGTDRICPTPGPGSPVGAPVTGGFGISDLTYMRSWVDAQQRTKMIMGGPGAGYGV